jgi:methionine synthase II (cobalamin-independent)
MNRGFSPNCLPTAVGSLPHVNPLDGVELVLRCLPHLPTWPQLPNADRNESFALQFAEGMPFLRFDPEKARLSFDVCGDIHAVLDPFYSHVLSEDLDFFAVSRDHARGFHAFIERLWRSKPAQLLLVKGQIAGPISLSLLITDRRDRPILHQEELFAALRQALALKARWQVRRLQRLGVRALIFLDEPYLSSLGTPAFQLPRSSVIASLREMILAIKKEGALAGAHCCGDADWSLLLDADVDVINFDADEHFPSLLPYAEPLGSFLQRGGVLAWGIVPVTARLSELTALPREEAVSQLRRDFLEKAAELARQGIPKSLLLRQSLLTPACGLGALKFSRAEDALQLLAGVSESVRAGIEEKKHKKRKN